LKTGPPTHLDPTWSLNRVRVVDLVGLDIPPDVKGRTAYELVSAAQLAHLIRTRHGALQLNPELDDHTLRLAFQGCLESPVFSVRQASQAVARTLGRNLGFVLLTLRRGEAASRASRPEWTTQHWACWAAIRNVWLGGGLVQGRLGESLIPHARQVMREGGVSDYTIQISPYGQYLPLVGAARYLPPGTPVGVVLDFGSSQVKRACAFLRDGELMALHTLPALPVSWEAIGLQQQATPRQAAELVRDMAQIIADTWREAPRRGLSPAPLVPVSLAAYIRDGQPMPAQGGVYLQVRAVTGNLEQELGRRISQAVGTPLRLKLLHDGDAAAAAYAGQADTAVITVGTALGIGFAPAVPGLRGLSRDLELTPLHPA
jgi:hypothetical protein